MRVGKWALRESLLQDVKLDMLRSHTIAVELMGLPQRLRV